MLKEGSKVHYGSSESNNIKRIGFLSFFLSAFTQKLAAVALCHGLFPGCCFFAFRRGTTVFGLFVASGLLLGFWLFILSRLLCSETKAECL